MSRSDRHGNAVSTTSAAAVARLDEAAELILGYRADPLAVIDAALAEQPDFAMGHAFRAGLMAMSMERGCVAEAEASIAAGWAISGLNDRELAHLSAAQAWCAGDFADSHARYGAIAAAHPRDLFAQQVVHQFDFFLGDARGLKERPAAAMRGWREDEPGFAWLLGMEAFGLEECGEYAAAEDSGRWALALHPHDAWATHAVAHVMEMQGRHVEGAAFLAQREADWAPAAILAVHNHWHRALFHLERGAVGDALAIYDAHVFRGEGQPAIELVDASAMLWRLKLRGAGTDGRFAALSAAWEKAGGEGFYAFNDLHALMAHLGAGRHDLVSHLLGRMRREAMGGGTNARLTREVGLPLAEGFVAFANGAHARAMTLIAPVRARAIAFGGSNAQRDVIALTLLEAALRAGDGAAAKALAAERILAKPESPLARMLHARARAVQHAARRACFKARFRRTMPPGHAGPGEECHDAYLAP